MCANWGGFLRGVALLRLQCSLWRHTLRFMDDAKEIRKLKWELEIARRLLTYVIRRTRELNQWPWGETPEDKSTEVELCRWAEGHMEELEENE